MAHLERSFFQSYVRSLCLRAALSGPRMRHVYAFGSFPITKGSVMLANMCIEISLIITLSQCILLCLRLVHCFTWYKYSPSNMNNGARLYPGPTSTVPLATPEVQSPVNQPYIHKRSEPLENSNETFSILRGIKF